MWPESEHARDAAQFCCLPPRAAGWKDHLLCPENVRVKAQAVTPAMQNRSRRGLDEERRSFRLGAGWKKIPRRKLFSSSFRLGLSLPGWSGGDCGYGRPGLPVTKRACFCRR